MTTQYDHEAWLRQRFEKALRPATAPMQRRLFLKLSGVSGLVIACSEAADPNTGMFPSAPGGAGTNGMGVPGAAGMGQSPGGAGGPNGEGQAPGELVDGEMQGEGDECPGPDGQAPAPGEPIPHTQLTAYVHIGTDNGVTLYTPRADMGQGVLTSLAMLIAEELEVDWTKVRGAHPDTGPIGLPLTVASGSISAEFDAMRQVGAVAREMLIAAAAQQLQVPAGELRAELGEVVHDASGQRLGYAALVDTAATLNPPANPTLLSNNAGRQRRILGTPRSQVNARDKAAGRAVYSLDVHVPDMLVGLVARPPAIGGSVASFNPAPALAVPGVRDVVEVPSGIAVLADHYWAAQKGREALEISFNAGPNANLSTASLFSTLEGMVGQGQSNVNDGNPQQAFDQAPDERKLDVVYELPYLAHAPMEPLNAVADVRDNSVEVWVGTQGADGVRGQAAQLTGVPQANVVVHPMLMGGGFGRRATNDYAADAIVASREAGRPVKLVYSREDDIASANYRPAAFNRLRGVLDESGFPTVWMHNIASQAPINLPAFAVEGAATSFPYVFPDRQVTWANAGQQFNIPVFTWRSVGSSLNGFIVESFLDELAALGGQDPLQMRLQLLEGGADDADRQAAALRNVAERSGWDQAPPEGRARGLAVHRTFNTIVAQVAEVSVDDAGRVTVHRVWAAIDCGEVVNPRGVEAQCEGSIMFGLSAALYGEIDLENGVPVQTNFDRYRLVRMSEAPQVEVEILNSGKATTGMGEPAVPPIAPAVCNAIFRLTGRRIRRLPIGDQLAT